MKPSSKLDPSLPSLTTLSSARIEACLGRYLPPGDNKLSFQLLYYLLTVCSILPQYLTLSRQNALAYNFKLIAYSLVVSFIGPAKLMAQRQSRKDPLDEAKLETLFNMGYCFCLAYPVFIVWDIYERFTPLKIVLFVY